MRRIRKVMPNQTTEKARRGDTESVAALWRFPISASLPLRVSVSLF